MSRKYNSNGSMELNFPEQLLSDFNKQMKKVDEKVIRHCVEHLFEGAEYIVSKAQPISPHQYGRLEGSGFVGLSENKIITELGEDQRIEARFLPYNKIDLKQFENGKIEAVMGFNTNYAVFMDEYEGNFSDPRAEKHFFTKTFEEVAPKIFQSLNFNDIK